MTTPDLRIAPDGRVAARTHRLAGGDEWAVVAGPDASWMARPRPSAAEVDTWTPLVPAAPSVPDADGLRELALWSVLDWSLWGNGLGDELRTAMADVMIAALSDEQREQAEACIAAWHERRSPSMAVGVGTQLQRERDEARAEVASLREKAEATIARLQQEATKHNNRRAVIQSAYQQVWDTLSAVVRYPVDPDDPAATIMFGVPEAAERVAAEVRELRAELARVSDESTPTLSDDAVGQIDAVLEIADRLCREINTGERGHPGYPARRTRWIDERRLGEINAVLTAASEWRSQLSTPTTGPAPIYTLDLSQIPDIPVSVAQRVLRAAGMVGELEIEPVDTTDPAPAAKPRVWCTGDEEPQDKPPLVDSEGDRWEWRAEGPTPLAGYANQWHCLDDEVHGHVPWDFLVRRYGPLTETLLPAAPQAPAEPTAAGFAATLADIDDQIRRVRNLPPQMTVDLSGVAAHTEDPAGDYSRPEARWCDTCKTLAPAGHAHTDTTEEA